MKLSELSKEQKQYTFLGALAGAIAIYCVYTFVLVPMKANWSQARTEVDELQMKVDQAERMIGGKAALTANLQESSVTMAAATRTYLPDPSNPLAWATRTLYAVARDVGLDVRAVSEVGAPQLLTAQATGETRQFGAYSVRVESECDYPMLRSFLDSLQSSNPYVCISGISIESKAGQPERHGVNLTIEWPAWSGPPSPLGPLGGKGV